jgi:colicin import membrane protein
MRITHTTITALLLATGMLAGGAQAALPKPAPTPAQQEAAAAKKAKTDAQAAKDKESLSASMDAVASRWRSRAAQQGWKTHPPVAIAAAAPAAAGGSAAPITGTAPAGQPAGQLTAAGAAAPIRSEKLGTAAPSGDVKQRPTQTEPRNAPPTVQKGTPDVKNR